MVAGVAADAGAGAEAETDAGPGAGAVLTTGAPLATGRLSVSGIGANCRGRLGRLDPGQPGQAGQPAETGEPNAGERQHRERSNCKGNAW